MAKFIVIGERMSQKRSRVPKFHFIVNEYKMKKPLVAMIGTRYLRDFRIFILIMVANGTAKIRGLAVF